MAEEVTIAQEAGSEVVAPVAGTVEAEVVKSEPSVPEVAKQAETVPLAVYLELKDDLKTLKQEMKEAKGSSQKSVEIQGLNDLMQKYPDVDANFISDMLNSATKEAQKKIEEKYTPIIERQANEKKQEAFNKAFDNLFEKTLNDNPEIPKNVDKDAIKALALTPQYRNVPLADILIKMYPSASAGKNSSENEMRSGSDIVDDVVSFDQITEDQKNAIMKDPKARAKYFSWLDTK